jgi:hypothetical protein
MRFMLLMIPAGYPAAAPTALPSAEMIAKMMKFNEDLAAAGVLLGLDGLHPPAAAVRVKFSGAGKRPTIVDGPFSEAKEALGGYWMLQVKSRAEAIEWASRAPAEAGDTIEIRQVQEMSDFPELPPISPELQKAAAR